MDNRKRVLTKIICASEHQINVTHAALWYIQSEWITIEDLAKTFHVSVNTINNWFCEAIAKNLY